MVEAAPAPRANQSAPAPRIDGRLKVLGQARYPADIAAAVRSDLRCCDT